MRITIEQYIKDLQRVYAEEGICSYFNYRLAGRFAVVSVLKRFGKWNHALKEAGLPLSKLGRPRDRKR